MAHRILEPPPGRPEVDPRVAIRLLRDAFDRVDVDAQAGAEHVDAIVAHIARMRGEGAEAVAVLRSVRERAVALGLADEGGEPDAFIRFVLVPGEPLFIGFQHAAHEQAALPLVDRCARALGYVVRQG